MKSSGKGLKSRQSSTKPGGDARERLPADDFATASSRDYPTRPFVGVGAVLLRDGAVLLVKRGKPPRQGEWSLPGGMQHVGETVEETLKREVREETGLLIEPVALLAVIDGIFRDPDWRVRHHYTLVDFLAEWRGGEPVAGDDAMECRWVPLARIPDYKLWQETERVIGLAAAIAGKTRPA